jgi:tetratricopeptide (TPR) repeat protein
MAGYHVFFSHNSKDKDVVERIARWLRDEHSLNVWLDKWNLIPGRPWQEALEKGLTECETIAVFLGEAGFGKWENEEMRVAIEAHISDPSRRVIPILLPGASESALGVFIRRFTWVDFRAGWEDQAAFHFLVSGIKGTPPGDTAFGNRPPEPETLPKPGVLLPGWRMPNYRNAVFTGREQELKTLARALLYNPQKTGTAVPQVITCTIGIGKTQLAVEFCYRYGRFFQGVHWINAEQDIASEIAACGAEMELPYWPETTPEQLQVTLRAWQKSRPHLLVLDSVENPELLHKWLHRLNGFSLLLTSRHHYWSADLGLQIHPLDLLSPSESLALLRKLAPKLKKVPDSELKDIAEQLGNLPLALDLAGRYLDERKTLTPQGYLKELNDLGSVLEHPSLLDWVEGDNPTNHETNLVTTFLLIWQQLNKEKPVDAVARKIFLAAGYCAPYISIPDKVIYDVVEGDERIADRALKRLYNLGLLTKNTSIHHLLAQFARHQDREKKALVIVANVLRSLSYEANMTGLPAGFAPLLPHVEATAHAPELADMRTVADDLWGNLGTHYRIVAQFQKAEDANRQALTIDEEVFGTEHTRTALRLNNLGRVLHAEGKLGGAKQHYEHALAIDEEVLGPTHPTVALRLNNLGVILKDLGDLKGAKEKFERALAIDEQAFNPHHPNVARDINNLGLVLKDTYELEGALNTFERARAIDEVAFGISHPNVARDLQNIGWVLRDMGKFKEALDAFRRAHTIDESAFGPKHPNVATDLNNIGWALREVGSYEEALELFNRARAIDEEAYGSLHPTVARDINNVGFILKDLGRIREAEETLKGALTICEKVYPPDHPEVAGVISRLGVLLKRNGSQEQAKQYFKRALEIDEKAFGSDHLIVARDFHNLGIILKDGGQEERGKQLLKRARRIYERILPADHPLVVAVHENTEIF